MNRSMKAALISAFIYPGVGHFYLKKHRIGLCYILVFSLPVGLIFYELFLQTWAFVNQINQAQMAWDAASLSQSIVRFLRDLYASISKIQLLLLMSVWVISIYDAYRIGQSENTANEP